MPGAGESTRYFAHQQAWPGNLHGARAEEVSSHGLGFPHA